MNSITLPNYNNLVITHKTLRRAIGIVGIIMPLILFLGALMFCQMGIQSSISAYYHTCMRDVFVGIMCVIGVFLFAYRGYENEEDNFVSNLGGIFAIGVAFFPTTASHSVTQLDKILGWMHLSFAVLFFMTLVYFSLCLFTRTDVEKQPTEMKLKRNRVYRVCGYVMAVALLLIVVINLLPIDTKMMFAPYKPIFWLEAIAIVAFGISWLTKGGTILID